MTEEEKRIEVEKGLLVDILQAVRESIQNDTVQISLAFLIEASHLIESHPEPEVSQWLRGQIEKLIADNNGIAE